VATLPTSGPILAIGADLKNTVTLVVDGQAFVSQHIGDLEHYEAHRAFEEVIQDLVSMYDVRWDDLLVVHDAHPQYLSTTHALKLPARDRVAVQHHRAHIASVLAERGEWKKPVLGVAFDGTGYGDDGAIWGGEIFAGSVESGFRRVAHLRSASLPGGDAAARFPVQAAAGFLSQLAVLPDLHGAPFHFGDRYAVARQLVEKDVRCFTTTSMGRLFDTVAALLGFTRGVTFEGQAAMWLEQLARTSTVRGAYPFPFIDNELDFRPVLDAVIRDVRSGVAREAVARTFQRGIAQGLSHALTQLARQERIDSVVLSGGVFQNELLLEDLKSLLAGKKLAVWTNRAVPPNDGGISLGQAAIAALIDRGTDRHA
jgi:hydrogenase maturation protein HypF